MCVIHTKTVVDYMKKVSQKQIKLYRAQHLFVAQYYFSFEKEG